mmetsp:Transcript_29356/g.77580  ORF Transcript_29356/g.77580 Transcript_29356/m.77580 type:complete len:283 (-) Transcript_29356:2932-3780(-)
MLPSRDGLWLLLRSMVLVRSTPKELSEVGVALPLRCQAVFRVFCRSPPSSEVAAVNRSTRRENSCTSRSRRFSSSLSFMVRVDISASKSPRSRCTSLFASTAWSKPTSNSLIFPPWKSEVKARSCTTFRNSSVILSTWRPLNCSICCCCLIISERSEVVMSLISVMRMTKLSLSRVRASLSWQKLPSTSEIQSCIDFTAPQRSLISRVRVSLSDMSWSMTYVRSMSRVCCMVEKVEVVKAMPRSHFSSTRTKTLAISSLMLTASLVVDSHRVLYLMSTVSAN